MTTKRNPIVKTVVCYNCKKSINVRQYSCYNHSDYINVASDFGPVPIGDSCCWNKLVNDQITFTDQGWTLQPSTVAL
jgi:hypothetical protein